MSTPCTANRIDDLGSQTNRQMIDLESIHNRHERLILTELWIGLQSAWQEAARKAGVSRQALAVIPALYSASLRGKGITRSKIALISGMPSATVDRHLSALISIGYVRREGFNYFVTDQMPCSAFANYGQAVKLVHNASGKLESVEAQENKSAIEFGIAARGG